MGVVLLTFAACDDAPSGPSDVGLGEEVQLAPGESVLVGNDGLRVSFRGITEDSRCPADALCVSVGQVVADLEAGRRTKVARMLRPGEALRVEGRRIDLVRVEPYPCSDAPIDPASYRATVVVSRD